MPPLRIAIALYTIVRKEVERFLRIWSQTLLPPLINQSLYFIIFGAFIGSKIGTMQGIPYMAYIVPGLVMMGVTNSAYGNVVSSFFGSKFQRNIEELLVSPTPNWVIVLGFTLGGVLRGLLVGLVISCVSFLFVAPQVHNLFTVLVFAFLTSAIFSLGGLLNGILATKFDDVSIIPTFVLTPLTYFGGVFYSIHSLPPLFQMLSRVNPILYMVDGFRYGFYGIADINIGTSVAFLLGIFAILLAVNFYALHRGIGLRS